MSAVQAGSRHAAKAITPAAPISLGESVLKWYDIAPADEPVPPDLHVLARGTLHAAADSGLLDLDGELGFVILHRCGDGFYFLLVTSWRNENELWETVLAKNGEADVGFKPWPAAGVHRPTFCVWELGAVCHERQAWTRFLRSPRNAAARLAYLHDTFSGEA